MALSGAGDGDPGVAVGLPGTGLLGYQFGDQLHPPMVDDETLWADGRRWTEAAKRHTIESARFLGMPRRPRVLDIGCGVGGPARTLVDLYDATVYGATVDESMLATARQLNDACDRWRRAITVELHDAQLPYERGQFTIGWSMNMLYQVADKEALLRCARQALVPGGLLLLEDWMLTEHGTADTLAGFAEHHGHPHLTETERIERQLDETGFEIVMVEDLGHVGRTHMARHFTAQFNRCFRPRIETDFPGVPVSGRQMCDEWIASAEATIGMYIRGELTYRRIMARR